MLPDTPMRKWFFCTILILIGLTGCIAIDMFVPAMPEVKSSFKVSALAVKLALPLYLVPFALGMVFCGPLTDCFGRKKILLWSTVVGIAGSILCASSGSIIQFYIGRVLEGAGYSVISVATPAITRDVFDDKQFAQISSLISTIFSLGPVFSPVIGSYITHYLGWNMIFIILSIYSTLILIVVYFTIPETLKPEERHRFHLSPILKSYRRISRNPVFLKNTLAKSAAYTGFIVFYAITPFMLQTNLHLTTIEYGYVCLGLTAAILLAKILNTAALAHISIDRLIVISIGVMLASGVVLLILALFKCYSVASVVVPFVIFGIGSGFLFSNATVVALKPFGKAETGRVAGLIGGFQYIAAFIGGAIAAHLASNSLLPLAILIAAIGVFMLIQYIGLSKVRMKTRGAT